LAAVGQILTDVMRTNCHVHFFDCDEGPGWGTWAIAMHGNSERAGAGL